MGKSLRLSMLVTDIGFLVYWSIVLLGLLPSAFAYKDFDDPIVMAWNLSFIPLDFVLSIIGLLSIALYQKKHPGWLPLCIVSLCLTFCAGLQAISFWALRGDFDIGWWIPNLFLIVYPIIFIPRLIKVGLESEFRGGTE